MPECVVKNLARAPASFPNDRHDRVGNPCAMLAREFRRGEDFVARVHVHVVLLGIHFEIRDSHHDRIARVRDVDRVIDDVARMRDPLPTDHELILGVVAKSVRHAARPACITCASFDRLEQPFFLFRGDGAHGVDLHDQILCSHKVMIEVRLERVGNCDLIPFVLEGGCEQIHALLGFVPVPAAPDEQRFFGVVMMLPCEPDCSSLIARA
jgi:hypothetical protein